MNKMSSEGQTDKGSRLIITNLMVITMMMKLINVVMFLILYSIWV